MKKLTVGLIGTLLVIMFSSNTGAHPSGLRIDLGGNGFGVSIYDNRPAMSPYWYNNYQPAPYYSGYYPSRPYLGWGGYKGHRHHNHHNQKHWDHHKSNHRHKGQYRNHRRNHNNGGHKHHGKHNRRGQRGNQWRR